MTQRASEEDTLEAWAELDLAIKRVECSLPSQMTVAIAALVEQRRAFDDLMLGRRARLLSAEPAGELLGEPQGDSGRDHSSPSQQTPRLSE